MAPMEGISLGSRGSCEGSSRPRLGTAAAAPGASLLVGDERGTGRWRPAPAPHTAGARQQTWVCETSGMVVCV